MEQKIEIITTKDGSHSLYLPELNETYHSKHGALTESYYVYIEKGIKDLSFKKEIQILEMGFGTALNALLTQLYAEKHKLKVKFTTLETHILKEKTYNKLNYPFLLQLDPEKFLKLHTENWEEECLISDYFTLEKINIKLEKYMPKNKTFDLIYFDAFAPNKQSEVWARDVLKKVYSLMNNGGILTTYCCQGQFKRDLIAAGFEVEKIAGPPGKREMLRGYKKRFIHEN